MNYEDVKKNIDILDNIGEVFHFVSENVFFLASNMAERPDCYTENELYNELVKISVKTDSGIDKLIELIDDMRNNGMK